MAISSRFTILNKAESFQGKYPGLDEHIRLWISRGLGNYLSPVPEHPIITGNLPKGSNDTIASINGLGANLSAAATLTAEGVAHLKVSVLTYQIFPGKGVRDIVVISRCHLVIASVNWSDCGRF